MIIVIITVIMPMPAQILPDCSSREIALRCRARSFSRNSGRPAGSAPPAAPAVAKNSFVRRQSQRCPLSEGNSKAFLCQTAMVKNSFVRRAPAGADRRPLGLSETAAGASPGRGGAVALLSSGGATCPTLLLSNAAPLDRSTRVSSCQGAPYFAILFATVEENLH